MDGLDLGGIMDMMRPFLPTISYIVNLFTKVFEIFTSYLGFDIKLPETEETTTATTTTEPVTE